MVTQAIPSHTAHVSDAPNTGSIKHMTARIRNQWSSDEKLDRRHQALLFQQQLLQACGLASKDGLEDVITVAK
jgi:transposase